MKAANRLFWPAATLLLAVMATMQFTSARQENQAWDEHMYLVSGYAQWKTGVCVLMTEHPALSKLLSAIPLLWLQPDLPTDTPEWRAATVGKVGKDFLYRNRIPAERILLWGRTAMMSLALAFGAALAWWTRRRFGAAAGLCALTLYCFDPNMLTHSRYAGSDMPLMVMYFLATVAAVEYLDSGRRAYLLLAGLFFAAAMMTKFPAVMLVGVFAALYALAWWRNPAVFDWRRLAVAAATLAAVFALVFVVVYWPENLRCLRGGCESFAEWGDRNTLIGRVLAFLHLPTHAYLFGLQTLGDHLNLGHPAYLLGQTSQGGWWYYFPVAFAVKSTVAVLIGLGGIVVARQCPALLIAPGIYLAAAMNGSVNIGLRHILPVYPFLFVMAGVWLSRMKWRWLAGVVLALQIGECAAVHPHYTAFFNMLAGGPGNGARYLVDSNLDWGQDARNLAKWLREHGTRRVYIHYFGNDDLAHEGLDCLGVPGTGDAAGRAALDGYVAVSATFLMGAYVPHDYYKWLRESTPVAKIGYSIYVYDLRRR